MTSRRPFLLVMALAAGLAMTTGCDKKADAPPAKSAGPATAVSPAAHKGAEGAPPVIAEPGSATKVTPAIERVEPGRKPATKPVDKGAKVSKVAAAVEPAAVKPVAQPPVPPEPVPPAGAGQLEVRDLKLAAGVEQRQPWGIGTVFPTGAKKVVAWTRIRNRGAKAYVFVVWTKGAAEVHRAKLDVGKSTGWRTWSSKRLSKGDAGTWRVAVVAPDGSELSALEFTVVDGEVVGAEDPAQPGTGDAAKPHKAKVGDPAKPSTAKTGSVERTRKLGTCRALVVVGGAKGVATLDVRSGQQPSVRARRGIVVQQGAKAFAVRVVSIQRQVAGGDKTAWQELWALELPAGKPHKLWGDAGTAKRLSVRATGAAGIKVRVVGPDGKATLRHLTVDAAAASGGKPGAERPKADKGGWVPLGDRCGHIRPSADGVEIRPQGATAGVATSLAQGAPRVVLGVTPLSARDRFDLRWMFNQRIHADTLLKKGRQQSRGGNFGLAIATLSEALLFKPADATIVGEMAWAALRKGNKRQAAAWSTQSLEWAKTKRQEAIAHYNLGRIAQDAGDQKKALLHYRSSFGLRANASVKKRIEALAKSGE